MRSLLCGKPANIHSPESAIFFGHGTLSTAPSLHEQALTTMRASYILEAMNPSQQYGQTAVGQEAKWQTNAPIAQPSLMGRLNEMLNHIAQCEKHLDLINGHVYGEGREPVPREEPSTLDGMASDACTRAAMLCGALGTLANRLGVNDTPRPAGR